LTPGDCIVALGGQRVGSQEEYRMARLGLSPTREVEMQVERGGKSRNLRIKGWNRDEGALYEHIGVKVQTRQALGGSFVEVTEVRAGGPAARLGLRAGDVIDTLKPQNDFRSWRMISAEKFAQFIATLDPGTQVVVEVFRDVDGNNRIEQDELHRGVLTLD
jgi:S1-C subfamily serine protease